MEFANAAEFRMKALLPLRNSVSEGLANKQDQMDLLLQRMDLAYQRYEPNTTDMNILNYFSPVFHLSKI